MLDRWWLCIDDSWWFMYIKLFMLSSFKVWCAGLPWSSEAYLLAESGAPEYLDPKIWSDSKRSALPTKLESKFDQILVSFCTEAAAWCWYKAFGPLLVFLNGTSSRNVLKTCEESCIIKLWCTMHDMRTEVDDSLLTVFHSSQHSWFAHIVSASKSRAHEWLPVPWVLQGASKWNHLHCFQEAGTPAATNCRFVIRLRRPPPDHEEKTPAICNFTWSAQCQIAEPNCHQCQYIWLKSQQISYVAMCCICFHCFPLFPFMTCM